MTEPTNLRALLGDRYDETRRVALRALGERACAVCWLVHPEGECDR